MMPIRANRVEQQVVRKSHPMWKVIDKNCFFSKNLYNFANYIVRQEFINNNRYINYNEMDKMIKGTDAYKELMSQPSQCTLQALDRNWKSFFTSVKDWKRNPNKYLGTPKLPKYLKKDGRFPWFIKNNSCSLKDGRLVFGVNRLKGYNWKTKAKGRLICVRFIPRGSCYIMEVVTEIEIPDITESESKRIASIDLGIDNLVTLANNIGVAPIIINGKGIKSINQFYNKRKAALQSELKQRNDKSWSKELEAITFKRNTRVKNFMHHASRWIVNWCAENEIDTLVVGKNDNWKQKSSLSKKVNQKFIQIPYEMLLYQLAYKCQEVGIKYVETEENYTSGTSFLDGEVPNKENYDKSRRVNRGLFKSSNGLINADVNGSYQIIRKVFPDAFSYGIEAYLTPTVINVIKVT